MLLPDDFLEYFRVSCRKAVFVLISRIPQFNLMHILEHDREVFDKNICKEDIDECKCAWVVNIYVLRCVSPEKVESFVNTFPGGEFVRVADF